MKKLIILLVLLFTTILTFAKNYYVSSLGNDTNNGLSITTPWKTLSKVQSSMSLFIAGDSILFRRGDSFSGVLSITRSGALNSPIVFGAYGTGDKPKFIGTGATINGLFTTFNRSYLTFDNLWITDPSISSTDRAVLSKIRRAFLFQGTSNNNCVISNCKIELVGVGLYSEGPSNTMQGCDVGNLRMVVSDTLRDNDYGANPVVLASSKNRILNNYFHDCWAVSKDYRFDGGAVEIYANGSSTVDSNFIAYNTFYDCNGGVEIGGGSGSTVKNITFAYNRFINNGGAVLIQNSGTYTTTTQNINLFNNVFVETKPSPRGSSSAMFRFRVNSTSPNMLILRNNVVQLYGTICVGRSNQLQGPQCVHTNNVYKLNTTGAGSVLNFTPTSTEILTSSVIWTNTTNTNPVLWNYTPTSTSVLIGRGVNVGLTRDFNNNPIVGSPEIGILEVPLVVRYTAAKSIRQYNNITFDMLGQIVNERNIAHGMYIKWVDGKSILFVK